MPLLADVGKTKMATEIRITLESDICNFIGYTHVFYNGQSNRTVLQYQIKTNIWKASMVDKVEILRYIWFLNFGLYIYNRKNFSLSYC